MAVAEENLDQFKERAVGRRINRSTADKYAKWIRRFETWYGGNGVAPDLDDLIDFDSLLENGSRTGYPWTSPTRPSPASYSYSSRNIAISALKLWFRYEYGVRIDEQPNNIVIGDPEDFDPEYLSRDDIEDVFNRAGSCPCVGCEAAVRLSYDAILRASELVLVAEDDIDLDHGIIDVHATKGSMDASLQLERETVEALRPLVEDANPGNRLFINSYGNVWRPNAWVSHFSRFHHAAGTHAFGRHSPIVHRLQYPRDFYDLDQNPDVFGQTYRRARHKHPDMTARYARLVGIDVPDWAE